ncbi:MAG: type II toxin-antitoxin system RelE family toxin [Pyrinomonadaceae bacterium]
MKVAYKQSFLRDLQSVRDKRLLARIKEMIEGIEAAPSIHDIPNLKPLRGVKNYFRLRIGDYRLGLSVEEDIVTLVRFLHRKDIYRYFP